jgi:hypothetical protein
MRTELPYRAELHSEGGILAILEHTSMDHIKRVIAKEWVPNLMHDDSIKIFERENENGL